MKEATMSSAKKHVDIKKVFTEKSPKLAKWIPGFVFKYLRRVLHEDFTNYFLSKHGEKMDMEFVEASIEEFNVDISVEGEENIPKEGEFIFVSNHPLGGFDGLVIMKVIHRHFQNFRFLVNDILMNLPNLKGLFIPINKHGKQALEAARAIDSYFQSDFQILTFPAGLVSRKIKGQIVDLPWQKSFVNKAVKYQRDVIPMYITGRNTNFFYRLANFRKLIGIKANLEMLYLVDETYKHRNKKLTVKFGEPIPWTKFDKSRKPLEWAKWVKEQCYALNGIDKIPL